MIAVDTNILVYAHRADSTFHRQAIAALDRLAASGKPWGVVWQCAHEFISVVTHPRIFKPPSSLTQALAEVDNWRQSPDFRFLAEGPTHWRTIQKLLQAGQIAGPQVHDARIAAVCMQHEAELWSADRDLSRFPALRVSNPLVLPE